MYSAMGNKATRTRKCNCDNPSWAVFEVRETRDSELVITLDCCNCNALWDSRSNEAKKYAIHQRHILAIKNAEESRKRIIGCEIKHRHTQILKLKNEIEKFEKELKQLLEGKEEIKL